MTSQAATLAALLKTLSAQEQNAQAVFQIEGRDIGAGYHVTELKLAHIDSIDCGGRTNRWAEAQMQLLDGQDGSWITVGKLQEILRRSVQSLPGLAEVPLSIEFAPENRGLSRFTLGDVRSKATDRVMLPLIASGAACKPALETGCCASAQACC
ncbi:MAG: DUF6428 family protein [Pseudomonadota bacterium]